MVWNAASNTSRTVGLLSVSGRPEQGLFCLQENRDRSVVPRRALAAGTRAGTLQHTKYGAARDLEAQGQVLNGHAGLIESQDLVVPHLVQHGAQAARLLVAAPRQRAREATAADAATVVAIARVLRQRVPRTPAPGRTGAQPHLGRFCGSDWRHGNLLFHC